MFEKSVFSVVATPASSILIRSSVKKKQKKKNNIKTLCPVTVLVDSQVSDRCPWATCYNMDWIANTKIGLDPSNSVIKRLMCSYNVCNKF